MVMKKCSAGWAVAEEFVKKHYNFGWGIGRIPVKS
jgi:hypothetical protein